MRHPTGPDFGAFSWSNANDKGTYPWLMIAVCIFYRQSPLSGRRFHCR